MLIIIYLFVLGLLLGSFLTLVGLRAPLNKSIVKPRSHCDTCGHILAWYELIPIISYIIQNGKCRKCKTKLSIFYPIIELISGNIFALAYIYFGFSYNFFVTIILGCLLIVIMVSDFNYMIILDTPLIITIILILGLKYYYFGLYDVVFNLISGLIIFGFMLLVKFLGDKVFKRESMGGGDIKLSFIFGLALGIKFSFMALVFGSFLAFPYALYNMGTTKENEIPFGPFLAAGLFLAFVFMNPIEGLLTHLK